MIDKPQTLSVLLGMNNILDPSIGDTDADGKRRTWQWQSKAENVNFTNSGRCTPRDGYTLAVAGASITGSFTTFAHDRFYVIDAGALRQINTDGTARTLADGLSGQARWAEINDVVFLSCGNDKLCIQKDGVVYDWAVPTPGGGTLSHTSGGLDEGFYQVCFTFIDERGREGGASQSVAMQVISGGIIVTNIPSLAGHYTAIYMTSKGTVFRLAGVVPAGTKSFTLNSPVVARELVTQFFDPPPAGIFDIATFRGRFYGAEYLPDADSTVVWFSEPMGYHLFNLNSGFLMVPGQVTQLAGADDVLLIVTHTRICLFDGDAIKEVAEYGGPPGQHVDMDSQRRLVFWTNRGLCRAAPFENLTNSRISVAPGLSASGGIIHQHGYTKFVVALKSGGAAYNKR